MYEGVDDKIAIWTLLELLNYFVYILTKETDYILLIYSKTKRLNKYSKQYLITVEKF